MAWSNIASTFVGGTDIPIGYGQANTTLIVNQSGCTSGAAYYCDNLSEGGYNDWFLPSLSEMLKLCDNRNAIGGFVAGDYWSSSEYSREYAYYTGNYSSPWWDYWYKNQTKRVRAVRYF